MLCSGESESESESVLFRSSQVNCDRDTRALISGGVSVMQETLALFSVLEGDTTSISPILSWEFFMWNFFPCLLSDFVRAVGFAGLMRRRRRRSSGNRSVRR